MLPWLNSCLVLVHAFLRVLKKDIYIFFFWGGGGVRTGFVFATVISRRVDSHPSVIFMSHIDVKSITRKSLKQ